MSSRLEDILSERMPRDVVSAYGTVLSTEQGRQFVAYLLSLWGWRVYDPAIKDGACATLHASFIDGMQEIARRLEWEAKVHHPELLRKLKRELDARDERYEQLKREETHDAT